MLRSSQHSQRHTKDTSTAIVVVLIDVTCLGHRECIALNNQVE